MQSSPDLALEREAPREIRLSFCTTCRDRLHHLRQTLPENLASNADHPALEWVLLDYNSGDGLRAWVRDHMAEPLASGRLRYFYTPEPRSYRMSHSRNVAFRLARGGILCNVDADNFTGPDFAAYVERRFAGAEQVFLSVDPERHHHLRDAFGRLCVRRRHFLAAGGYDEAMSGYGWEELDLSSRLEALGLERLTIDDESYLRYLRHGAIERAAGLDSRARIVEIYRGRRPEWPASYSFLLRRDGTFRRFGLPADAPLKTGTWSRTPSGGLRLGWTEGHEELLQPDDDGLALDLSSGRFWLRPVTDPEERATIVLRLDQVENEARYRQNLELGRTPNAGGFGRATVVDGVSGRSLRVG